MNASVAFRWLHAEEILLGRKQFEGAPPCDKTCSIGDAARRRHFDSRPRREIRIPASGHTGPEAIGHQPMPWKVNSMTIPETPAALWLRHVLDDEIERLHQELRMKQCPATPTVSGSVLDHGALAFILLFAGLFAIACVLLLY